MTTATNVVYEEKSNYKSWYQIDFEEIVPKNGNTPLFEKLNYP